MRATHEPLQETVMSKFWTLARWASAGALGVTLSACNSGSASDSATGSIKGDVPIAYAMRANTIRANPTNGAPTAPGGDLIVRAKSSPSAAEHNLTAAFTQ